MYYDIFLPSKSVLLFLFFFILFFLYEGNTHRNFPDELRAICFINIQYIDTSTNGTSLFRYYRSDIENCENAITD